MTASAINRLAPSASDRAFRVLVAQAREDVEGLVRDLVDGRLSPSAWSDQMLETLTQAHAEAGYRGRLRAGDLAPYDRDDLRFGQLVAQEEAQYLWGFERDLESGRYGTDATDAEAIGRRAAMYVDRLYGTANEALALVAGDDELWHWALGFTDHCADCVRLAGNSPYRGKPPTLPRMNSTQCFSSCGCTCQSSGGLNTFQPE